jgi:hypothetical protein
VVAFQLLSNIVVLLVKACLFFDLSASVMPSDYCCHQNTEKNFANFLRAL